MRIAWLVYGELAQPTGGYVYDRLVVEGLRAHGHEIVVLDPAGCDEGALGSFDAAVGDALCVRELGPLFERAERGPARLLLVHHLPSWEIERADRDGLRRLEARALAACDALVVTGHATAVRVSTEHPGHRVEVVPPGADRLPRVEPRAVAAGGRIELLLVGSLVPRKRALLVLDAVEALAGDAVALTLVGDATRDPTYAAAVAERVRASPRLSARVMFAGVVADAELARRMAGAGALVLASSLEGYGMVVAEALWAGLPAIVSREAAPAAGLDTGDALFVFEGAAGLCEALRAFSSDADLRARMRRAACRAALPRWADAIAAFESVLTRAAAARGARGRRRAPRR